MPKGSLNLKLVEKAASRFQEQYKKNIPESFIILHPKVYSKIKRMGKLRALARRLRGEDV